MTVLNRAPTNTGYAQPNRYTLVVPSITTLTYFLQDVNLPGIAVNNATQATPFKDLPRPGDKAIFNELACTFIVDEELWGWEIIYDWIRNYSFPCSYQEYRNLKLRSQVVAHAPQPQYSDGILTINNSQNNSVLNIHFVNLFPISLSDVNFTTKGSADDILTATVVFQYHIYNIRRL